MTRVVSILGGERELGKKIQKPIDFDPLIRKGMPQAALYHVKKNFDLSDETLASHYRCEPSYCCEKASCLAKTE